MLERGKYFTLGVILPMIFGLIRFLINQGNYHANEMLFIIFCIIFLFLCIKYMQEDKVVTFSRLEKKQLFQILIFVILDIVFLYIYTSIFKVSSGASSAFVDKRNDGYSFSFILSVAIFSPIEEELCLRGCVQKGTFQNSWLGIVFTSGLFSYLHSPFDAVSFLYYAISGLIYGVSYKLSDNLLVPILCHISYNSFIVFLSLI
ncbi:CPBP family intramembrane glutamic endopeptidase [Streptococcus himalayensis]|uniref:Protease n=1 Tax=Streptococcus himalayensis TaxID=1888195 RepID=A0A917EFM6_9STRE|nr:CPBP family intramembrane glutamic endopeptidase [Streptococcus himalayensis]GGE29005.1 protease [Streptococcus himalayensis]